MNRRERAAGTVVPLSALRRERDSGIGEFADLVPLAEWAAEVGLGVIGLLPLGESPPGEASPYSALSTFAFDPLYVRLEDLPELEGDAIERSSSAPRLDREAVAASKLPVLERAHTRFEALGSGDERRRAFSRFRSRAEPWLADYAIFRALTEAYPRRSWRDWPEGLRRREKKALARARDRHASRVAFFEWVQFVADEQWRGVRERLSAMGVSIYGDLPFAPGVQSADVWASPESFDLSRSAGAPPDAFSATGQNWGLPMYDWEALRGSDWRLFRRRMRHMAALYDLIRVDHVVGLFRTWGFLDDTTGAFDPEDEPAQIAQGREILEMLVHEAAPSRLLAEDLGVIPDFVGETMLALDLPGYKIFRWVHAADGASWLPASEYPECSLASTGTHDTDTLVGWWRSAPPEERAEALAFVGRPGEAPPPEIDERLRDDLVATLYRSPSRYVVLPIQDLFGWPDRINVPATVGGANWRWRLPIAVERLPRLPRLAERARSSRR